MNPEFLRNVWLEAQPFRLALIAGILLLLFTALSAGPLGLATPHAAALALYCFFTVLWGTRSAALSVVGEIRERTWDSQKLSSIGPVQMVWGKLFGATIHNWFGGLLCLPVIVWPVWGARGPGPALTYGAILLLLGVLSQAVALLSSLVLIRRNTGNWRLDTFLCQVAGIMAAFGYYTLWSSADAFARTSGKSLAWWGHDLNLSNFHLVSLCLFTGWALVGCWRAMRAELHFANGPFVWMAWLAYICLYDAGFEAAISGRLGLADAGAHPALAKLALAGLALLTSTYSMVFLEPKDPVRLRGLGEQVRASRFARAFLALDAWMLSYAATLVVGALLALLWAAQGMGIALAIVAMLGFLTRDVALFVLMRSVAGAKGDFAALAVLAALYLLVPALLKAGPLAGIFLPLPGRLLSPIAAWTQGIGIALWAAHSMRAKLNAH